MQRLRIGRTASIIAQHKPLSFLSPSTDPKGNKRYARDLLMRNNLRGQWKGAVEPRELPGLQCAGRLDADSSGLLLWTDDAALSQYIIGPNTPVEKEYLVRVSGQADFAPSQLEESLALLREGISLDGAPLLPTEVSWANESQLKFVLREGALALAAARAARAHALCRALRPPTGLSRAAALAGRHRQIRRMLEVVGLRVEARAATSPTPPAPAPTP